MRAELFLLILCFTASIDSYVPRKSAFNFIAPDLHMLQETAFSICTCFVFFAHSSNVMALYFWKINFLTFLQSLR